MIFFCQMVKKPRLTIFVCNRQSIASNFPLNQYFNKKSLQPIVWQHIMTFQNVSGEKGHFILWETGHSTLWERFYPLGIRPLILQDNLWEMGHPILWNWDHLSSRKHPLWIGNLGIGFNPYTWRSQYTLCKLYIWIFVNFLSISLAKIKLHFCHNYIIWCLLLYFILYLTRLKDMKN